VNNYDITSLDITNPYAPPKAQSLSEVKPILTTSKNTHLISYLFLGTLVGTILVCGTFLLSWVFIGQGLNELIAALLLYIIFGYPFGLIIGGIPAALTAILIKKTQTTKYIHLHAFSVAFITSFIFYALCLLNMYAPLPLALIGGISATVVRHRIYQQELEKVQR